MKNETIAADITKTLAARKAGTLALHDAQAVTAAIVAGGDQHAALDRAIASRNASLTAEVALKRIPLARRTLAASIITAAERIAHSVAYALGGRYSGDTRFLTEWGTRAEACTHTTNGDQYSRRVTYKKTNATHCVTLDPLGVAALVENEPLRNRSGAEGLPLIALYPDGSAVWVKTHGKGITSERGWIAGNARVCFHSTVSMDHAQAGFLKKLTRLEKEEREARLSAKQTRRARLVARLCHGITATLADAKAMGYCEPGIRAFQSRFGIADTATLPELVRTGDPSAVRLALKIARNAATLTH